MSGCRVTSEAPGGGEADSQHPPLKNPVDGALSKGADRRLSDKRRVIHIRQKKLHPCTGRSALVLSLASS